MKYQAIMVAPDGDYVTDYSAATVEDVWERVDDGGSRWFFYPYPFVITARQGDVRRKTIIGAPEGWEWLTGCTVATATQAVASMHAEVPA